MRQTTVIEIGRLQFSASAYGEPLLQVEAVLRKQTDVMFGLGGEALRDLSSTELFWRPAPTSWSVSQADTGWVADWIEPEPAELPPPTLAWQLWHCSWWLSMVIDHSFELGQLTRDTSSGPDPVPASTRSSNCMTSGASTATDST